MDTLLVAAVLPIVLLCFFVYKKDPHREPMKLLMKIFVLGFVSAIPVIIMEILLDGIFPTENISNFILIFINVFISVALVEEGFKWIITMFFGYRSKEFDEIYDVIAYAVFSSLGFACIENILYVFSHGLVNALLRALISIPGHMCFGIMMGYFLSQAKIGSVNKHVGIFRRNIILSILLPTGAHALYDALLLYSSYNYLSILIFFALDIAMVVICIITVSRTSKIQQNLDNHLNTGVISTTDTGGLIYNNSDSEKLNYCPICGTHVEGFNYCPRCGFKIK